jgi:uncharacterized protein YndB with AHSA1/START domain
MEYGTLERELYIEATPDTVFEVISRPDHVQEWWPDEADYPTSPGSVGAITFGDPASAGAKVVPLTVLELDPPRRFSFRWDHPAGEPATPTNSLMVTFDLLPRGGGTLLRLTETGFREQGWEAAVLQERYREHVTGWDHFLPRLADYASRVVAGL